MSWIKVKSIFSVLLINVVIFFLQLITELTYFVINPFNKESQRITCGYDWVLYNYCPNSVDVMKNTDDDGGNIVFTYTNGIGQRVKNLSSEYPSKPQHVFVGDSFIKAEEVEYTETFYG